MQKNFNADSELSQAICKIKMHATRFFDDCETSGISIPHHPTLFKIRFWIGEEIIARIGGAK